MNALTRDQIKAMRAARTAAWRWDHSGVERAGELDLSKDVDRNDGFGAETLHVRIPAPARVANYGQGEDCPLLPATSGCWVQLSLPFHPAWRTFAHFVRVGDLLEQEWVVDNRNNLLKKAGLTTHELSIRVSRPTRDGKNAHLYTFVLDARVLDPHSLADNVGRRPTASAITSTNGVN